MLLEALGADQARCPACRPPSAVHRLRDGIWRLLAPDREAFFQQFIAEYEAVRRSESRGCDDPAYYRALPFSDLTGRFCDQWRIRAKSFRTLVDRVLPRLEALPPASVGAPTRGARPMGARRSGARRLRVLDLGAGNGWLSYRLSMRGHHVVAVDLLTNTFDGLGAHSHYDAAITPVQAEFDRLPFDHGQADLAIFNASLHYSAHYETTLREALRVLSEDGWLVILDSPVYRDSSSGEQMVREREAYFEQTYGFPSNSIPSENYLTFERLNQLQVKLGIRWELFKPFYGWRWALKPWWARLRASREPARFLLIVGHR
jgi:SAM-dependent methyltransferase